MSRTERFISELETTRQLIAVAHNHGIELSESRAHEAWAEHSDDYCAGWLCPDSEDPNAELIQAARKYLARRER